MKIPISFSIPVDFSLAGLGKGIYKFLGVIVCTFVIGGLTAIIPELTAAVTKLDPTGIILSTGLVIGAVKALITWVTTEKAAMQEENQKIEPVNVDLTQSQLG